MNETATYQKVQDGALSMADTFSDGLMKNFQRMFYDDISSYASRVGYTNSYEGSGYGSTTGYEGGSGSSGY